MPLSGVSIMDVMAQHLTTIVLFITKESNLEEEFMDILKTKMNTEPSTTHALLVV